MCDSVCLLFFFFFFADPVHRALLNRSEAFAAPGCYGAIGSGQRLLPLLMRTQGSTLGLWLCAKNMIRFLSRSLSLDKRCLPHKIPA